MIKMDISEDIYASVISKITGLILWSDNFENLFHNACPSYEVKECRKTVVLPCNFMASA